MPCEQYIHVRKIISLTRIEITITQITPTGDTEHTIGQPHLDMHASAQGTQIRQKHYPTRDKICSEFLDRVEHAHFNIRMRIQNQHLFIASQLFTIIKQHAHAYTTLCRIDNLSQQQTRAQPFLKIVVLQIQTILSVFNQCAACSKCLHPIGQWVDSGIIQSRNINAGYRIHNTRFRSYRKRF